MIWYKFKKLIRQNFTHLLLSSFGLTIIATLVPLFVLLFIGNSEFSRRDKTQMSLVSIVLVIINLFSINYTNETFSFGIITTLVVSSLILFFLFFIFFFIFIVIFELSELELNQDEVRDAKLEKLLKKLF